MTFHPITLKNRTLPINVFYAPMASFSDVPFRVVSALFLRDLCFVRW